MRKILTLENSVKIYEVWSGGASSRRFDCCWLFGLRQSFWSSAVSADTLAPLRKQIAKSKEFPMSNNPAQYHLEMRLQQRRHSIEVNGRVIESDFWRLQQFSTWFSQARPLPLPQIKLKEYLGFTCDILKSIIKVKFSRIIVKRRIWIYRNSLLFKNVF